MSLLPQVREDLGALTLGLLADSRRLGACLSELLVVLPQGRLGGFLGLLRLFHAALDSGSALGVRGLEPWHHEPGDEEGQQQREHN